MITANQKHITQLSPSEFRLIAKRYNQVTSRVKATGLRFTYHALDRMEERGINRSDFTFKARLIEYRRNGNTANVLVRQENGLCYSVALNDGCIITCYWNHQDDNHDTLDWSRYNANLKVIV